MAVKLKSRTENPVGGFMFTQAETGATFRGWDFNSVVREIVAHRKANPRFNLATEFKAVADELDTANALRMLSIEGAEIYVDEGGTADPKQVAHSLLRSFGNAVGATKNLTTGLVTLLDWLGEGGKPVEPEVANMRAAFCARCPQNKAGDLTSWFTQPASELIRKQIEARKDLELSTPFDERLGVCEACGCALKLKCHTPIEHIVKHMPEETGKRLPERCWVLTELKEFSKPEPPGFVGVG